MPISISAQYPWTESLLIDDVNRSEIEKFNVPCATTSTVPKSSYFQTAIAITKINVAKNDV